MEDGAPGEMPPLRSFHRVGSASGAAVGGGGKGKGKSGKGGLPLRRASTAAALTRPSGGPGLGSGSESARRFTVHATGGVLRRGNTMPAKPDTQGIGSRTAPRGSAPRKLTARGASTELKEDAPPRLAQMVGSQGSFVARTDEELTAELCTEEKLKDRLRTALRHVREADVAVRRQTQYLVGQPAVVIWTYYLVRSGWFTAFITLCILGNTAFLAMDHRGITDELISVSETGNFILTIIFALEMVLKLIGLGFWEYVRDPFNDFDGVIVIISLVELVITSAGGAGAGAGGGAISALRMLRLLRVLKLAKNVRSLRILLVTIL